jgi:ACS family glucarate transporter-like MFS transporter
MNMANQIGGMITVSLTPFLADSFGWSAGFSVAAVAACLGAIAWLFVNPGLSLSPLSGAAPFEPRKTA